MKKGKKWTDEEKEYLQNSWGMVSIPRIAKHLGRTEKAIRKQIVTLRLGAFLENGDYITWNQLQKYISGGKHTSSYTRKSWIENRGCPVKKKLINKKSYRIVYIDEFWKWAEKNQDFLDFSNLEEYIFGYEPEWARQKRKRDIEKKRKYKNGKWTASEEFKLKRLLEKEEYSYHDLAKIMHRTENSIQNRMQHLGIKERPVTQDNTVKWTEEEWKTVIEMLQEGYGYELISEQIGKTAKSIRGKVYRTYQTESPDKVRKIIKTNQRKNENENIQSNAPKRNTVQGIT